MLADVVFLIAIATLVVAAIQLYSRWGSGIAHHPYHHVHGSAPGAARQPTMSSSLDRDITRWTRGTR
jgi:hypothetical protein